MAKIRVLIIDDSALFRRLIADCLAKDPSIEVVGTAPNGQIGLAKIQQVNPDLVTLDVEMPVMNGLETVAAIRKTHKKLPVIMFSTLTERGAVATLDALSLGASDYVPKPLSQGGMAAALARVEGELVPKIKGLCPQISPSPAATAPPRTAPTVSTPPIRGLNQRPDILAVGASTGGPNALAELLPELAKNFPVPIVIVQHMPPLFTKLLAERLAAVSARPAQEGVSGVVLRPGEIYVAPGGSHLEVTPATHQVCLRIHDGPPENSCRPSVDVLFRSVARTYGARTLAVVLTGMGQDGLHGCQSIRDAGGQVLVQDEASSVVWGMPGAVVGAGLAESVLPIKELAREINRRVGTGLARPAAAPLDRRLVSTP